MPSVDHIPAHRVSGRPHPAMKKSQRGEVIMVSEGHVRKFADPVEVVEAYAPDEVMAALKRIESYVVEGYTSAGFLAYEAAPAFDTAFKTHALTDQPLLWFGIYESVEETDDLVQTERVTEKLSPQSSLCEEEFEALVSRVREYIGRGDTYQVNLTFPLHTACTESPLSLFWRLHDVRNGAYQTYIDTGRNKIVSLSPELFFALDGNALTTRPMKGTAKRGLTADDDEQKAKALSASPKDRAENIMIVDLLRNDMGRISETGTVQVERKFEIERYPTLWQMTSTISSRTNASVPEIFKALFPSGSVTGAPKIRTMDIIYELESQPRGPYCGAIGWWGPNRQAEFSVGIRTATVDSDSGVMTYPVGAGITWDSAPDAEYRECLLKAEVLNADTTPFELLESFLWDGEYFLLDRHMKRLRASAVYFGFRFDEAFVRRKLEYAMTGMCAQPMKVRLLLSATGDVNVEKHVVGPKKVSRIRLASEPVDECNAFLYHKTTRRDVYEKAFAESDSVDDVLLWNSRGEITESTRANVAVKLDGKWLTPPVECGLLAGTYRGELLAAGELAEQVITKNDLGRADEVRLINSVRKWIDVEWV